jgi:heme oxygenase (mycobilin-producing)
LIAIAFHATEPEGEPAGVLYRALRPDVAFRFVSVGEGDGYEVVREEGDPDDAGGVVLIDPFEVPEGEDGAFLAAWDAARATLAQQRGYLGARLHRAAAPARFRFVEVARWSSPLMVSRAFERPEFALYQPM